jgi:hypothetical protein
LGEQPADIPPFEIKVNLEKWETYKNKGPVRPQTAQKEAEISKHVADMLKTGVIEPSRAIYTNHPVIVKKADGNFRFCIDFRNLNDCTEGGSWPLPNIKGTFARIGEKKPDIFGVMDLTSGYHQAPLHPAAKIFTAFICFAGVYQFTRLPFGPKRAPSYFQQMMTSVVLFGLIYIICEMYLDDCIVFGTGPTEFVARLRQIFMTFSKQYTPSTVWWTMRLRSAQRYDGHPKERRRSTTLRI